MQQQAPHKAEEKITTSGEDHDEDKKPRASPYNNKPENVKDTIGMEIGDTFLSVAPFASASTASTYEWQSTLPFTTSLISLQQDQKFHQLQQSSSDLPMVTGSFPNFPSNWQNETKGHIPPLALSSHKIIMATSQTTSKKPPLSSAGKQKRRKVVDSYRFKHHVLPKSFHPSALDIVCGKNKFAFNHEGNRRFRGIIARHLQEYMENQDRDLRTQLILQIVEKIRATGGRFVKYQHGGAESSEDHWVEIGDKEARNKVGHAIRDLAVTRQNSASKATARTSSPSSLLSVATSSRTTSTLEQDSGNSDDDEEERLAQRFSKVGTSNQTTSALEQFQAVHEPDEVTACKQIGFGVNQGTQFFVNQPENPSTSGMMNIEQRQKQHPQLYSLLLASDDQQGAYSQRNYDASAYGVLETSQQLTNIFDDNHLLALQPEGTQSTTENDEAIYQSTKLAAMEAIKRDDPNLFSNYDNYHLQGEFPLHLDRSYQREALHWSLQESWVAAPENETTRQNGIPLYKGGTEEDCRENFGGTSSNANPSSDDRLVKKSLIDHLSVAEQSSEGHDFLGRLASGDDNITEGSDNQEDENQLLDSWFL